MQKCSRLARGVRHGLFTTAICFAFASAPAVAQLRLHSNSEEEATSELDTQLEKAHTAHIAALDAHRAYVVEALERDRKLIVERQLAERDAFLTSLLEDKSGKLGISGLQSLINLDFAFLAGATAVANPAPDFADNLYRAMENVRRSRNNLEEHQRYRTFYISEFEKDGGEGTYCKENGDGSVAVSKEAANPALHAGIDLACRDIVKATTQIQNAYKNSGAASGLLGDPHNPPAGELGNALTESENIATLLKAQRALAKVAAKQVKDIEQQYQCEIAKGTLDIKLKTNAEAIHNELTALASGDATKVYDSKAIRTLIDVLLNKKVEDACKAAPDGQAAPQNNPPQASQGLDVDTIVSAIAAVDKYAAGNALLNTIREAALAVTGSSLNDALVDITSKDTPQTKAGIQAKAAVMALGGFDKLNKGLAGKLPDTSGILVALADVRMRQATAKIESDRLAELDRLAKLLIPALQQKAAWLIRADAALNDSQAADAEKFANGLRRYAESWNKGEIPAVVIANDMTQSRYLPWVDREKAVVEAAYAMLAPATAQLKTYGKGGISADTLAQFLQAIGLGSIAVK